MFHYWEEHFIVPCICSLLGLFIVIFSMVVLFCAPGRTNAIFGTVFDPTNPETALTEGSADLLVLLDGGHLVKVHKPEWLHLSMNKTVILQETSPMFLGIKSYSFYNQEHLNL